MSGISIHDSVVTGLTISCEKREIVIHTEFGVRKPSERTDVVFHEVEAYHIVGDNMHSILFDVIETAIDRVLAEYSSEFENGVEYSWPGDWNNSVQACREYLAEKNCKSWEISSSYGMSGFVIAKSMELKSL